MSISGLKISSWMCSFKSICAICSILQAVKEKIWHMAADTEWHLTVTLDYIKCNTMTKCQKVKVIVVKCNDSCSISTSASPIFVLELTTYGSWQRVTLITMKAFHPTHSKEYLVIIVNCGDHWLICSVFIRSMRERSWHMALLQKSETLLLLKLRWKIQAYVEKCLTENICLFVMMWWKVWYQSVTAVGWTACNELFQFKVDNINDIWALKAERNIFSIAESVKDEKELLVWDGIKDRGSALKTQVRTIYR